VTARVSLLALLALLPVGCARPADPAPAVPAPAVLPAAGVAVAPPEPRAHAAIAFAEAQVGKPYCWGGSGPRCFDCSGLVQSAWRSAAVRLPRTSTAQGRALDDVPLASIRPGDILWWPHHVGLYVGNGEMIDAYHTRAGVVRRRAVVPARVLRVR
jgi:cell wall-associated NlpC family hydrolase